MSELAFDVMGEPVEFPEATEELRVRRFRNPGMRGACELVHDRDGAPLYVPVDTGYLEFRAMVDGVPGRYRLDPVGEDRRGIPGAAPAYVTIAEMRNTATREGAEQESVIRELARANAEMVKTMAEKFAEVMRAAAELLRAADGAGLPRREPAAVTERRNAAAEEDEEEDDQDDDDELDEDEDEEVAESPDLAAMIAQLMPMLQMWLASKVSASQQPAPAVTPKVELAPPLPPVATPPAPPPAVPLATPPPSSPRNDGLPTAAQQVQLFAVYNQLEPDEKRTAQEAVMRMPSDVRAAWIAEMCQMKTADAVAKVRSLMSGGQGTGLASPAQQVRLLAIYAALEPFEAKIVQRVLRRMSEDLRPQWLEQICALSTEEAVHLVRSMIPPRAERAPNGHGSSGAEKPTR